MVSWVDIRIVNSNLHNRMDSTMEKINISYYSQLSYTHTYYTIRWDAMRCNAMCCNHSFWIVELENKNVSHVYISDFVFYILTFTSEFQSLFGFSVVCIENGERLFNCIFSTKSIGWKTVILKWIDKNQFPSISEQMTFYEIVINPF